MGARRATGPSGSQAGLTAHCPGGQSFPAEATFSRFDMHRAKFYTLILRNVHDRVEAERKIQSLTAGNRAAREARRRFTGTTATPRGQPGASAISCAISGR